MTYRILFLLCVFLTTQPAGAFPQEKVTKSEAVKPSESMATNRQPDAVGDGVSFDGRARIIDAATRAARLHLLEQSLRDRRGGPPGEVMKRVQAMLDSKWYWNPFPINIQSIEPQPSWPDHTFRVHFVLQNNSNAPTSGIVQGNATQNSWQQLAFGRWFEPSAKVTNLGPGQSFTGTLELSRWSAWTPTPGPADVELDYWVEDPNGTLTIVERHLDPNGVFIQTPVTYSNVSATYGSVELYPACKPDGPDFLQIDSFTSDPASVILDPSGSGGGSGQSVTLSWKVSSGGFPAEGTHPGSISGVSLSGGPVGNPVQVSAIGQRQIYLVGVPVTSLKGPINLLASGNCGQKQTSLQLGLTLPPPKILSFSASPTNGYVYTGSPATLSWQVGDCALHCRVSMIGVDGLGATNFSVSRLPTSGSVNVTPPYNSVYSLTATSDGGTVSANKSVTLYSSMTTSGSTFYFKMTNANSQVTPCFTLAIFAPDATTAKKLAEQQNGGYTATQIDASELLTACG
jgi:hypothetical protein